MKDFWHSLDLIIHVYTNPFIRFVSLLIREVFKNGRYDIIADFIKFRTDGLLWNSLGYGYQQNNLRKTLLDFNLERKIRYDKSVERYRFN